MGSSSNSGLSPIPKEWPEELANLERVGEAARKEAKAWEYDAASGPALNWLFVDLNSYFASVEQETRPELRGRPVGVVPMMADTTCCIAASYDGGCGQIDVNWNIDIKAMRQAE